MTKVQEIEKVEKGFDRGLDFNDIKDKLVTAFDKLWKNFPSAADSYTEKIIHHKMLYCLIAMLQLRNGSRISEACKAAAKFFRLEEFNERTEIVVKISKSEKLQYNNKTKKKIKTNPRFRKMRFPFWISKVMIDCLKEQTDCQKCFELDNGDEEEHILLRQRVRDYLIKNFNCNTHSLRYAFINYMLHDQKKPMNEVAKFVGHKNTNQICTYTQNKNVDKLFDIEL